MASIYSHPAIINRLQHLTNISASHNLRSQLQHTPTPANIDTVRNAEAAHKSSVTSELSHITHLLHQQEKLVSDLRRKIEAVKKSATASGAGSEGSLSEKRIELCRLQAEKQGAEAEYDDTPYVPSPDSGLNVLIAVRGVVEIVEGFRSEVSDLERRLDTAKEKLRREERWVGDARSIQGELQRKIGEMEGLGRERDSGRREDEKAIESRKVAELEKKKKEMSAMSGRLAKELARFVKERLGVMVAVEEAGGPVVGSELNVETLKGYLELEEGIVSGSIKGKAKKARERGQKRLDEIWGAADDGVDGHVNAEKAAGQELLELVEAMLNKTLDEDAYAYTDLPRDSAASRFLIRSFVAQLNPKDALKLRLVDFAGRIEDAL